MKTELSIIIPCYNASLFIDECLSSILAQIDDSSVEVIVINDGSTDDSLSKIEQQVSRYPLAEVKVISQQNSGVSAARNRGIVEASGTWLSFIDSDDRYSDDFMSIFNTKIKASDADLIEFDATLSEGARETRYFRCSFLTDDTADAININSLGSVFKHAKWFTWSRFYKRALFIENNLRFPEGYNYEDIATIPLCYLHARKVAKVGDCLINYRVREGSLSNQKNVNDLDDLISVMKLYKKIKPNYTESKMPLLAMVMDKCFRRIRELAVYNDVNITPAQRKDIKPCLMAYRPYYALKNKMRFSFLQFYIFYSVEMKLRKKK